MIDNETDFSEELRTYIRTWRIKTLSSCLLEYYIINYIFYAINIYFIYDFNKIFFISLATAVILLIFKISIIMLTEKSKIETFFGSYFFLSLLNCSQISAFLLYALPVYILGINLYLNMDENFVIKNNKREECFLYLIVKLTLVKSFLVYCIFFIFLHSEWDIVKEAFGQILNPFSYLRALASLLQNQLTYLLLYLIAVVERIQISLYGNFQNAIFENTIIAETKENGTF
ncbi:MAG: hypothetical protein IKW58_01620 [Alphaproteobacteria bacterium]|nr:hypothetical protein [Alphaproteobacteria bacterium]